MAKPELDETPRYKKLREELRRAEIALAGQRERVAELRRALPLDTAVADYVLREGPADLAAGDAPVREVSVSQLFERPGHPLVLMHFMYGGKQVKPCPMCTMWADGYDAVVPHLRRRMSFGVVVAGDLAAFRAYARERGWRNLRILSSAGTSMKRDLGMEEPDGAQNPGMSVFARDAEGRLRHFYTGGAELGDGHWRGMDLLSPVWHYLDLLPQGRGDFMPGRDDAG